MLNALTPLTIAVVALTQAPDVDTGYYHISHAFGKTYKSRVDRNVVSQTPAWDETEESPPVSPRQALKLVDKMRRSIAKAPDGWEWKAMNLHLFVGENPCAWYVMYQAVPVEPEEGPIPFHELTLIVLMDGTVIKPVVSVEKPEEKSQD